MAGMVKKMLHCSLCLRLNSFKAVKSFRERTFGIPIVQNRNYGKKNYAEQCLDIVKKYDFENYLCSLLLPWEARSTALAVQAFNVELAQVRDTVTDITIGRMRIQFWRDAIEEIYKESPPHSPVCFELAKAVHRHKLTKTWLTRMIDAREENLSDKPFVSLHEVEAYAEKSVSSVHYLVLQSLGINDLTADHTASHVGKATGITTLLRAVPFNGQRQRVYLPVDLMIMHGVSQDQVVRGRNNQALQDLVYDIASQANAHIQHARFMKKDLPKAAIPVFNSTSACAAYLKTLQRVDFNLFDGRLQQRNNWLPLVLYLNTWTGKF